MMFFKITSVMKIYVLLLMSLFVFFSCTEKQKNVLIPLENKGKAIVANQSNNQPVKAKQLTIKQPVEAIDSLSGYAQNTTIDFPENYTVLGEALGDLDKDDVQERVVIFDTGEADLFAKRVLSIYKRIGNHWEEFYTSKNAVLSIGKGGIKAEPFYEVSVIENVLIIKHLLRSNAELVFTHKYRFQDDDFYLIGLTNKEMMNCDYNSTFDYNLATGKIIYEDNTIACDEEENESVAENKKETFYNKLDALPTLANIEIWEHNIVSPKLKVQLYY